MRKFGAAAAVLGLFAGANQAHAGLGNGLPGAPSFNLQIIAHTTCKSEPLTGTNRHSLFLKANYSDPNVVGSTRDTLDRTNKIMLQEGPFGVLDGNACDGNGAKFSLPANPFSCSATDLTCENPTFQGYEVYMRLVGKPGTGLKATTCGFTVGLDGILGTTDDTAVCSAESVVQVRTGGKSRFQTVTKELTTMVVDVDADGDLDRVGIFDARLMDYFWSMDTTGKAHAQVVFIASGS